MSVLGFIGESVHYVPTDWNWLSDCCKSVELVSKHKLKLELLYVANRKHLIA